MNLAEIRTHVPLVNKPKLKKKAKAIRKTSKKMATLKREYMKLREDFLLHNPYCEWCWKELNKPVPATEIHHRRGRGKYLNDTSTWMAVSADAHKRIHANPALSYAEGYMLPRR